MQRHQRHTPRPTRRSVLAGLGLAAAGLGTVSQASAAADTTSSADNNAQFVVEQGDQCVPLVPLSGDVPVAERYGWAAENSDFSATGLVDLQRPDTSILFLYDGPNGLSLVIVHDQHDDGTGGGSATFAFAGLPTDGEWVVQDDFYDGPTNFDRWTRNGDRATVDWTWGEGRTDGGAFRGLGSAPELELSIDPSFNADAALYGEYYDGEITAWEVLSASADGPTRTSLALDEPIVIRRGTCSTGGKKDDEGERDDDDDDDEDEESEGEGRGPPESEQGRGRGPPESEQGRGRGPPESEQGRGRGPPESEQERGRGPPESEQERGRGPPENGQERGRGPPENGR